jgi:hypothetical protein
MRTLRLTQHDGPDGHRIDIALTGEGACQSAAAQFERGMNPQDREDLRWYLEDSLEYPLDPAPEIAARVEQRLGALGRSCRSSL